MSELVRYNKALLSGDHDTCASIEKKHGLYGYPPEIVSIGLKAADEGRDPGDAVDAYIDGEGQ